MKGMKKALVKLSEWFGKNKRILPWRSDPSVYRVWVSEIMLQQTQVATVVPYFNRFLRRFPTLEKLASASQEDVMLHWAGLGYYSRARNLHCAARMVNQAGKYPRDREGWLALPGVGEYTAGAVLSIALNRPEAILDANVKRVIARLERFGAPSAGKKADKNEYWAFSEMLVKSADKAGVKPRVTNQALMELGALVCRAKEPQCGNCPLSGICLSYKNSDAEYVPQKKRMRYVFMKETVHAVMDGKGRVLLTDRGNRWRKGLWDFPLEKPPVPGIKRKPSWDMKIRYVVTNHKVERKCLAYVAQGSKKIIPAGYRWVSIGRPSVAMGAPGKKLIGRIGKPDKN